ncbi:MAG: glycogen synthase GlgA [Verrucomicrobiota bacterium]
MRILLASSEVHPYSKTGGLADMVGSLAKALARSGHEVRIVTPLYHGVRAKFPAIQPSGLKLDILLASRRVAGEVLEMDQEPRLKIYFIEQPAFYSRSELYTGESGDYADNAERFIFFSKAVVQLARGLDWQPEVVHAHDWQSGLVPLLLQHEKLVSGWGTAPGTCFTIHNLAYQGTFSAAQYPLTNLPWDFFNPNGLEFYGRMNCMKAGIAYSDVVTTVSPRYAREITTEDYGCGLDGLLRHRQRALTGILNGVDYEEWNTTHNRYIKHPYSAENLENKTANKLDLQAELGLTVDAAIPLFGCITRLVEQKGVDIMLGALEEMLRADIQFTLLGVGAAVFVQGFQQLQKRYPGKVCIRIGYDTAYAHQIEAASDFYLMPSRFEPCGLNQMYSLRYGTVPIVRAVGGLDDTIIDIAADPDRANGIKFLNYTAGSLAKSIRKALALFAEPELLAYYRRNGMESDFSWEKTAGQYVDVYERAIRG